MAAAKKTTAKQKTGATTRTSRAPTPSQDGSDAVALLKADHRKVEALFDEYESADSDDEKSRIARQVCQELITHTHLEEDIFYAECREQGVEDDLLDEAQVEHDGAKVLIADLMQESPGDEYFDAKVTVLKEYIKHHVGEEEKPSEGIFAKAQAAGVDMSALGQRLQAHKQELMQRAQAYGFKPPQPQALAVELNGQRSRYKGDNAMPRQQYGRDRDEQGRFVSDDDDRYSSRSRGRYDDDDDRYSRPRSNDRPRDDEGRFMSDDDDDYRSRRGGRGQGGWFGDPEGHSEASRRGWDEREGGGRYSQSRGPSRSSRARYDEDDDDDYRSSRGRGHGGWFGDPEGHSRAAEEGWEHRGGGRSSSRGRDYDDDDDDRRGPRRGQSHGGWFGDPRGHAEASRRGWQNRR